MPRIYCAGPLFNDPERAEMARIAEVLEDAGFSTFLPHRDGLEFSRLSPKLMELGLDQARADATLQRAIFALDVYQLLEACDGAVINLNGRVPDEGTVVEASLAWRAGKPLVLYKADARSLLGGADNPMVLGLGAFECVAEIEDLPAAISRSLDDSHATRVGDILRAGRRIAEVREISKDIDELAVMLARS